MIATIDFDFDTYDFWAGWTENELEGIELGTSMETYFQVLARSVASSVGVKYWTLVWERSSGTGHRFDVVVPDETALYKDVIDLRDDVQRLLSGTYIDQDIWIVYKEDDSGQAIDTKGDH